MTKLVKYNKSLLKRQILIQDKRTILGSKKQLPTIKIIDDFP